MQNWCQQMWLSVCKNALKYVCSQNFDQAYSVPDASLVEGRGKKGKHSPKNILYHTTGFNYSMPN